jgi:hypothetical protein
VIGNQVRVTFNVFQLPAEIGNDVFSIPNQEDHGFYPWVNWSSGTGCSPLVGVFWESRALPVGLHKAEWGRAKTCPVGGPNADQA